MNNSTEAAVPMETGAEAPVTLQSQAVAKSHAVVESQTVVESHDMVEPQSVVESQPVVTSQAVVEQSSPVKTPAENDTALTEAHHGDQVGDHDNAAKPTPPTDVTCLDEAPVDQSASNTSSQTNAPMSTEGLTSISEPTSPAPHSDAVVPMETDMPPSGLDAEDGQEATVLASDQSQTDSDRTMTSDGQLMQGVTSEGMMSSAQGKSPAGTATVLDKQEGTSGKSQVLPGDGNRGSSAQQPAPAVVDGDKTDGVSPRQLSSRRRPSMEDKHVVEGQAPLLELLSRFEQILDKDKAPPADLLAECMDSDSDSSQVTLEEGELDSEPEMEKDDKPARGDESQRRRGDRSNPSTPPPPPLSKSRTNVLRAHEDLWFNVKGEVRKATFFLPIRMSSKKELLRPW